MKYRYTDEEVFTIGSTYARHHIKRRLIESGQIPYLQKKDVIKISEAQKRNSIKVLVLDENQLSWEVICTLI